MKTIYKTLMLGVFLTAVAMVSPAVAQDVCTDIEANAALYAKYTENYKGNLEQKRSAIKAGKEYLEKYQNCKDFTAQLDWLKRNIEKLGPSIEAEEAEIARQKRYERFNKAVKADIGPEIYASGEDILKHEPDFLDVIIVLADVGLDEAEKNNDSFNVKAINYAKDAIKRIDGGATSKDFGVLSHSFQTKDNTLGWMNYTIGFIEFYRLKRSDSGLDYFYKSTQLNSGAKDRDFIYGIVGDDYRNKAVTLNTEIEEIIKTNEKETFESKSKLALSKGYVDRAIDAYSRAYDVRKANLQKEKNPAAKAKIQDSLNELYETLKALYRFRYETIESPIADDALPQQLNTHIASVTKTPFVSPKTAVVPVDPPDPDDETKENDASTSTTGDSTTKSDKPKAMPSATPKPPTSKATTTGASVKSDADRSNNKPKQR